MVVKRDDKKGKEVKKVLSHKFGGMRSKKKGGQSMERWQHWNTMGMVN